MAKISKSRRASLAAFFGEPWNLRAAELEALADVAQDFLAGSIPTTSDLRARLVTQGLFDDDDGDEADEPKPYQLINGVAVVRLEGILSPNPSWWEQYFGATSTRAFAQAVQAAAADPECKAICLAIDSPGGRAAGCEEAAQIVRSAAQQKPCLAFAEGDMCSAAYMIGSAAGTIVASASAQIGSIGTLYIHRENSKANQQAGRTFNVIAAGRHKADGNQYEPLSKQGRETLQELVDSYYAQFVGSVARSRNTTAESILENYGQGKTFLGQKAVAVGLADRVGTLQQCVDQLAASAPALPGGSSLLPSVPTPPRQAHTAPAASQIHPLSPGESTMDPQQTAASATPSAPVVPVTAPVAPAAPVAAVVPAVQPATPLSHAETERVRAEERSRIENIRARGQVLGCDLAAIDTAVNNGVSVEQFLMQATEAAAHREPPVARPPAGTLRPAGSEQDAFRSRMIDMLAFRCLCENPGGGEGQARSNVPSRPARQMDYMSAMDVARASLKMLTGRDPIGSATDIAQAALGDPETRYQVLGFSGNYQTPGDFPNILSGLAARVLEQTPPYQGTTFQEWAYRRPSVPDRRPTTLLRIGEFGELPLHPDGDVFEQSVTKEDYSWIQADEYADAFGLSPMMIEHDDLGAFTEALRDKQTAHDMTLNRLCINLLVGNVTLGDGYALFDDTNHGNAPAAANSYPTTTTLTAVRKSMRKQKGISGIRKLNYRVTRVLIPEDIETQTELTLSPTLQVVPVTEATAQPFRGTIRWSVDPMLADYSAAAWYYFADPAIARAIVYAYQVGYESMRTTNWYNPKNHCRIWDFAGRFAAGVNNYRGVGKAPGA